MRSIQPFTTLKQLYLNTIRQKNYRPDPGQALVADRLQQLSEQLTATHPAWLAYSSTIPESVEPEPRQLPVEGGFVRGLYIHGSPGCGKTFLMSLLYEHLKVKEKQWSHFNQFMMELSNQMHRGTVTKQDQITVLSNRMAREHRVVFLDQFQVVHISDAMVLKRVFEKAFSKQITLIATSNRPPDDLYRDGLMRERFEPFIPVLKHHCQTINLDSKIDYRQLFQKSKLKLTYLHPLTKRQQAMDIFKQAAAGETPKALDLEITPERRLKVGKAAGMTALFTFQQICESNLGPRDYMGLAHHYHTVVVTDMPKISSKHLDAARRFIWMVDQFYQNYVKLVLLATGPLNVNVRCPANPVFDEQFALERVRSRLEEMQSEHYLAQKASCEH